MVPASAWVKAVNRVGSDAASMPMPLSATLNSTSTCRALRSAARARSEIRPARAWALLNLTALPARWISTWRSRVASPSSRGGIAGSLKSVRA
jgi:hypothetical protein